MTRGNWTGGYDASEETYDAACEIMKTISFRGLQYNRMDARRGDETSWRSWIPTMLSLIGYSVADIDRLKVIQITATKGKGSTAAFTAALLQRMGGTTDTKLKIGRFTTPAMLTARDQIAINGTPVSERLFAAHFFKIWNRIRSTENPDDPHSYGKPRMFYILYVVAVSIFLEARVDAAVFEVFSGGWNDCTNVVRHPLVSSVGNVGLDHVRSLGNTEEKIAKEKSGVFKTGGHAVTVVQKRESIDDIVKRAAYAQGCRSFTVVDELPALKDCPLGLSGDMQRLNASLALTLVAAFVDHPRCPVVFRRIQTTSPVPSHSEELRKPPVKPGRRTCMGGKVATDYRLATCTVLALFLAVLLASPMLFRHAWTTFSSFRFSITTPVLSACLALWSRRTSPRQPRESTAREPLPTIRVPHSLLQETVILEALRGTILPGRGDVVPDRLVPSLRWLLDCAHTPCSMPNASSWAKTVFNQRPGGLRLLMFTIEPYRPAREMFRNILGAMENIGSYKPPFDHIIFVNDILHKGDYQNNPSLSELDIMEQHWRVECCHRHPDKPCTISKLSTLEEGVDEVYRLARGNVKTGTDCFSVACWPGDIHLLTRIPMRFSSECVINT